MDFLLIPLLVYASLVVFAWLGSDGMIFHPQPASYRDTDDLIRLKTPDGLELVALHLVNPTARHTILYSHGNAEDLGDERDDLEAMRCAGFSVFAYDYRGYGLSDGRPSTKGAKTDIETAYAYLTTELAVAPGAIIVYGRSVGGGPSTHLAAAHPVGGLVLQSTFTSAFVVMTKVPLVPFDKFNNLSLIQKIDCPLLVIHGRLDRIVPFQHGERLYERALSPKQHLWLDGIGHNQFPNAGEPACREALTTFAALVNSTD
ncbi:MAG: alpha/beta hydrolase [Lentisphaeria bacterium]|nr:alpha/beta hydrolase [Lentisphaeria bacterium]